MKTSVANNEPLDPLPSGSFFSFNDYWSGPVLNLCRRTRIYPPIAAVKIFYTNFLGVVSISFDIDWLFPGKEWNTEEISCLLRYVRSIVIVFILLRPLRPWLLIAVSPLGTCHAAKKQHDNQTCQTFHHFSPFAITYNFSATSPENTSWIVKEVNQR